MILDDSAMAYNLHLDISISIPCSSGAGGRGRWEREGLVKREKRGYTFFLVGFVYIQKIRGQEK